MIRLLLLLSIAPALFSCRGYQIVPGSTVITPFEKCFSNDSLQISFSTYAPYELNTDKASKRDRKLLKRVQVDRSSKVLFVGFNDFNYPHYLIGLLEDKGFDVSGYKRMRKNAKAFYYDEVKAKLDSVPMFFDSRSVGGLNVYEAVIAFEDYTARFLYVTDSIMGNKYMSEFGPYGVNFSQGAAYSPCSAENPFTLAWEGFKTDSVVNYLKPLGLLHSNRANYQRDSEKGMLYQAFANYYSLVNESDSVAYYWGKLAPTAPDRVLVDSSLAPASPRILELAKRSPVIMFNEAHTYPSHRYFVGTLLDSLYSAGFRYLALEALGEDSLVNRLGFPTTNSGFYTNEPTLANLIRQAKRLGYHVLGYDSQSSNREYEQANNLFAKTLAADSLARIVVLAGHGHIDESAQPRGKKMAVHFREISGINPITVDQTALEGFAAPKGFLGGAYILNEGAMQNQLPVQIQSDLMIYNGFSLKETDNCFASSESEAVSIEVPQDSLIPNQSHVLLVYRAGELAEGSNPVPTAIRYMKEGKVSDIRLCPGDYVAVVNNYFGEVIWQNRFKID